MGLTTADKYYLKAKSASQGFGCDWEEVCDALHYALSYDEHHPAALCLLGSIYAEQFSDYENAFTCFDTIISNTPEYLEVYYQYSRTLVWANEIERSQRLIAFALKQKTIDKAQLYTTLSQGLEMNKSYALALQFLKQAQTHCYNEYYQSFIEDEIQRVKKKKEKQDKKIQSKTKAQTKKAKKKSSKKK